LERALPTVEGVVLASSRMSDSAIRMSAKQKPMVVMNRAVADVPSLVTDNPRGVRRAAEHLASLGHTSITYVAGPEASWADGIRWRSLREAELELEISVRRVGPFPPTVSGGEQAVAALGRRPTSAVLAYNDQMAIGLIRGLTAAGLRVPGDVSIVGFDNIFAADLVTPGLTTVAAPLQSMGVTAVRNLLAMVHGARSRKVDPTVVPVRLVVRASTGPVATLTKTRHGRSAASSTDGSRRD
jgi:LacI family transcriptional regulator, repressor for deo operon, udp, cdd, tsx, nupC, and nupG